MRLVPLGCGQVPLQGPALVNGAALVHQLLAEPCPERFDPPAATVGHEEDPSGERQAAPLQIPEQGLTDLMILRGALPKS